MPAVNSSALPARAGGGGGGGGQAAKPSSQVTGERCHMLTRSGAEWPRFSGAALTGGLFFKGGQQGWRKQVSPSIDFPHLHLPASHASGGPGSSSTLIERPRRSFFHLCCRLSVARPPSLRRTHRALPSRWQQPPERQEVPESGFQGNKYSTKPALTL